MEDLEDLKDLFGRLAQAIDQHHSGSGSDPAHFQELCGLCGLCGSLFWLGQMDKVSNQ
jgi:hypothetical protein